MAFDLNKNEEIKSSPTKFDLSKSEAETTGSKLKTWLIGLVAVAIVGGGIWYYTSPAKPLPITQTASPASQATDSTSENAPPVFPDSVNEKKSNANLSLPASEKGANAEVPVVDHMVDKNTEAGTLNNSVPVTFAKGSVDFASSNKALMKRITQYLSQHPAKTVEVNGYASSDGSLSANQNISQARAEAFKNYLIKMDIEESRIIAQGKGIVNPIASNKSNSGRQKNRRVEVVFP